MHSFEVSLSSSKHTFVPDFLPRNQECDDTCAVKALGSEFDFRDGFDAFLRLHPHADFTDSDCRLAVSEDWIQSYHFSAGGSEGSVVCNDDHMESSPYELALLVWRLLDVEHTYAQDKLINIATNSSAHSSMKSGHNKHSGSKVHPDDSGADDSTSSSAPPQVEKRSSEQTAPEDEDNLKPERLAESFKQRSSAMYKMLTDLEEEAEKQTEIDAKRPKGLKRLVRYRNNRAMSRLVFPGVSYLVYLFFATLMAIIMTNGFFDEPTRFTHAVVEELGWGTPQKKINQIATFNDLTLFWSVLAGFLWQASPMARPFGKTHRREPFARAAIA
jgi:hypothetical protein